MTTTQQQQHKEQYLAGIQVPDEALHSRFFAGGLTAYDYQAVIGALTGMDALLARYNDLLQRAGDIIHPYDQYPGDLAYAPAQIQRLNKIACADTPTFQTGNIKHGGRQEQWPVATWQTQMATYRRIIARLEQWFAEAEEACAVERVMTDAWTETLVAATCPPAQAESE